MKSFLTYLKNVRGELDHVVWPKPRVTAVHTGLIILISAIIAVYLGLLDYLLTSLVALIVNR